VRSNLISDGCLSVELIPVSLSYLHTLLSLRLPSMSPERLAQQDITIDEIKSEVTNLVPFLMDQKSTLRYTSAREAWSAVWETIGNGTSNTVDTTILLRLLRLIPPLLHPPIISDEHPRLFLVLSDLYRLFAIPKAGAAVPRKLLFYIAAMGQLNRVDWLGLEYEVEREIKKLEGELGGEDQGVEDAGLDRPAIQIV
jgi:hypothetical protein